MRFVFQQGFDGDRGLEAAEKRFDAEHHDRVADGGNVGAQVFAPERLDVGEHAHGQQRVLQHDGGDVTPVDPVDVLPRLVESACGLAQDRYLCRVEIGNPAFHGIERLIDHRLNLKKYPRKWR